ETWGGGGATSESTVRVGVAVAVTVAPGAWAVSVYCPGGVDAVVAMCIVAVEPKGVGDGTGLGSNVAVISPPGGGAGDTLTRLRVTSPVNRAPPPPNTVTVAEPGVPRHASSLVSMVIAVISGLVTMQSSRLLENSVWTS